MHEWRAAMEHCYMTGNRHTQAQRGGEEGGVCYQLANNTNITIDLKNIDENKPMTGYISVKHETKDIM